jgi:hypothetical protein
MMNGQKCPKIRMDLLELFIADSTEEGGRDGVYKPFVRHKVVFAQELGVTLLAVVQGSAKIRYFLITQKLI